MAQNATSRLRSRTAAAFAEEERDGLKLALKVRVVALTIIIAWQAIDNPETGVAYYFNLLEIFAFMVLGAAHFACLTARRYAPSLNYVFVALDCALMAVIFSVETPFVSIALPPAIIMDTARFLFFFMFLMQATFSLRPSLVLWSGFCVVVARAAMWLWFAGQPGVYTNLDLEEQTAEAWIAAGSDLNFLFLGYAATEFLVVSIVAAGLAVVVARSRNLVRNRLFAERTRASLARYFSPNVADRLSRADAPFATARQQEVAVLFADIIGFTKLCENAAPGEVVDLLRGYHDRLGRAVFDNQGTLDKYIGDGMMATFGTPDPTPDDAANALTCAFDMIAALEAWNAERRAAGAAPIRVGVGVHFGAVVAGDIGNDRRLEYSVIGDTVNVASRLEQLTRSLGAPLVVSDDLVAAAGAAAHPPAAHLGRLARAGEQEIRGREGSVPVWVLAATGRAGAE